MRNVYIHVGFPKTGTSLLQQHVFPRFKDLQLVSRPFTQCNHSFNRLQTASDEFYFRELVQESLLPLLSDGKDLLISDESFCGLPYTCSGINRSIVAYRLKDLFPEATILLFIRGQRSVIHSLYNQWVKSHGYGIKPLDEFIWMPDEDYTADMYRADVPKGRKYLLNNSMFFYLNPEFFMYLEAIELYRNLFPTVKVITHEKLRYEPEKVLADLESLFHSDMDLKSGVKQLVNRKLSDRDLYFQQIKHRASIAFRGRVMRTLYTGVSAISGMLNNSHRRLYEVSERKEEIFSRYHANNHLVAERFPEAEIQNYPSDYFLDIE